MSDTPSRDLLLTLADANLAAGIQYGLWVEASPSVEEQISLSSMSQDKLGHARAYLQMLEERHDEDPVSLQFDREAGEMAWPTGWTAPLPTWSHLVVAQALFSRALLLDVRAVDPDSGPGGLVSKIDQEEAWHERHGDAWLRSLAADDPAGKLQAALDDLWPHAVAYFAPSGVERFPADLESGVRTAGDDELRTAFFDEVVPLLHELGLQVDAEQAERGWSTDPAPTDKLVAELRAANEEHEVELLALLQDPEGRELAELA